LWGSVEAAEIETIQGTAMETLNLEWRWGQITEDHVLMNQRQDEQEQNIVCDVI
jgi:hypothetical protein